MSEKELLFGRYKVMGCPWHGLVTGNSLALPNGSFVTGKWNADGVRGAIRIKVPGAPGVTRSVDDAALDVTAGREWRDDAVLWLDDNDADFYVYGRKQLAGQTLYCQAPGNCWRVALPYDMTANGTWSALVNQASASLIGHASYSPVEELRDVTVTLSGFHAGITMSPGEFENLFDCNLAGSAAIVGKVIHNGAVYQPDPSHGFALLQTSGAGSVASPLAIVLAILSDPNYADVVVRDDSLTTWTGVLDWVPSITVDWIDPIDDTTSDSCQWIRITYNSTSMTYDAAGTPSAATPAVSHKIGYREARLDGYVIGWWMDATGTPQPVTLDLKYRLEATHAGSGSGTPGTAYVNIHPYDISGGSCAALPGDYPEYDTPGSYNWTGALTYKTTETLSWKLYAGGALIDQHDLKYEHTITSALSGTGPMVNEKPPSTSMIDSTVAQVFTVDGTTYESHSESTSGDSGNLFAIGDFLPTKSVDLYNYFDSADPVSYWLPLMAQLMHGLPAAIRTKTYGCSPYWWSNRLVCLRERFAEAPLYREHYRYGFTAYPGGATGSRIDAPLVSGAVPPPIYGALSPFGGTPLLGQSSPVCYV